MNRKETTEFLGQLLIYQKFRGVGKYWASEVSIDYGTINVKRVDFMQFKPVNQVNIDGIEKGIFICYEVKSCKNDFNSGFGKNFIGEKNYFVMPMSLYKEVINEIPHNIGVLVPVPDTMDKTDGLINEFDTPTPLDRNKKWRLEVIKSAHPQGRKRSMSELLFCMLRSKH